jgi:hypothetical protein
MQQGRVLKRFILPAYIQATFDPCFSEKTSMLLTICFTINIVATDRKIPENF